MFDGKYFEWNQKRIKGIVDFYGYKFFYMKRLLDLGCGYADMSGVLYRLGSDVTAVDARQEHLKIVSKKFPGIKVTQADLDGQWPFFGQKYDLILDLGLLCHLSSYEAHLKAVCASTSHLVLETAVCDSTDPNKCIKVQESKATYDLAYGGMGCRPSPAAIEKVLTECGMTFKRVINAKYNASDEYKYDWAPQGDDSTSIGKRAIWFASREGMQTQLPGQAPTVLSQPTQNMGFVGALKDSGVPVRTTVSPRVPISARTDPRGRGAPVPLPPPPPPQEITINSGPPVVLDRKPLEPNAQVRKNSKDYSVIQNDQYAPTFSLPFPAVVFPTTYSSKMWCKKIASSFPGMKLFEKTLGLVGIEKVNQSPDVILCSIDNIQAHKRIWIDEWVGPALTIRHIDILKGCGAIITPSLLNAQEIWKHWPQANIIRSPRPWPLLAGAPSETDYYLYLEKSEDLTKLLFAGWDDSFGKLVVVGATTKMIPNVKFVSEAEPYTVISNLISGAKAVIDLSDNNYYQSGIISLALGIGVPVISNNQLYLSDNTTFVQQDKKVSPYPTSDDIKKAITKFKTNYGGKGGIREDYNNWIEQNIRKMLGV